MCRLYGSTAAAWAVWQARADEVLSGSPSAEADAARRSPEALVADTAAAACGPVQIQPVPAAPVPPAPVLCEPMLCEQGRSQSVIATPR
jgi:hypothetical protein